MSHTYTGSPGDSDVDTIRFYTQDTDDSDWLLSDEEIQFIYDTWYEDTHSLIYVSSVAAEMIAGKFAREISVSADGVNLGTQELQNKYEQMAISLRNLYKKAGQSEGPSAGGILIGEEFDDTINPLNFGIGIHDNRRGGQQNYGGHRVVEYPNVVEY